MNNINIMGRIANDLDLRCTENGNSVLKFTVAVKRPKSKDTTDFIKCVAWRNAADFIFKWFSKGKMIAISGIETSRSWKDESGNNHSVNELLVDTVEFCGDKKQEEPVDISEEFIDCDDDIPFN